MGSRACAGSASSRTSGGRRPPAQFAEIQDDLDSERMANVALRQSLNDLERRATAAEDAARVEVHALDEAVRRRTPGRAVASAAVRETLTNAQNELATAHAQVAALATEVAGATARADQLEQNRRACRAGPRRGASPNSRRYSPTAARTRRNWKKTRQAISAAQPRPPPIRTRSTSNADCWRSRRRRRKRSWKPGTREYEARVAELDTRRQTAVADAEALAPEM